MDNPQLKMSEMLPSYDDVPHWLDRMSAVESSFVVGSTPHMGDYISSSKGRLIHISNTAESMADMFIMDL